MSDLLNSASLVMIPSGYKEDVVYSQIPTDGSGDLSFTRASNGTRVNSAGLVEVCPWNLAQYSEEFNNAIYVVKNAVTIVDNSTTAPNGTTTADLIYPNSSGDFRYVAQAFTQPENIYTLSVYAKAQNKSVIWMYIESSAGTGIVYFDLSDGTMSVTAGSSSTPIGTMTAVGNGWYRCTYTVGASLSLVSGSGFGVCDAKGNVYATASGTNGVYFWGYQLNIGSTAKPYFPTTDRLNVPRLTYQNGGGGCPSLLLEKQSTNLATYSEEFDNAAWGKYQCSISANQTTSPDGTQNADKLTLAVGSGTYTGLVYRLTTPGANSIFMKNDSIGNGKFYIQVDGVGNARWNSDGTLASVSGGTATNGENMGNGWFRFTYVCSGGAYINYGIENGTTGDSIFIWGAQVEASSYPTSYIPTTSSSATRVADACFKTGISSLIGQTQGSVFFDFIQEDLSSIGEGVLWYMKGTGTGERYVTALADGRLIYVENNGSTIAQITKTGFTNGRHKCAIAYATNDFVFYVDGVQIGTDTSGTPSGFSEFGLRYYISTYTATLKANEAVIFPTRLTNAELASLTTI